jgi:hypothetical protein
MKQLVVPRIKSDFCIIGFTFHFPSIRLVENLKLTMKPTSPTSSYSRQLPNRLMLPVSRTLFSSTLSLPATEEPRGPARNSRERVISILELAISLVEEIPEEDTFDFPGGDEQDSSPPNANPPRSSEDYKNSQAPPHHQ